MCDVVAERGVVAGTPPTQPRHMARDESAAKPKAKQQPRDGPPAKRVSLWNVVYRRRICGNSAPMEHKYLAKHPECEVFCGQDTHDGSSTLSAVPMGQKSQAVARTPLMKRVTLWHKIQRRKIVGNAAPLERNVDKYLQKHPEYEIYDANGHEREKDIQRAVEKVLGAIVTSVANQHRQASAQVVRKRPGSASGRKSASCALSRKLSVSGGVSGGVSGCRGKRRRRLTVDDCAAMLSLLMSAPAISQLQTTGSRDEQEGVALLLQVACNQPPTASHVHVDETPCGLLGLLVEGMATVEEWRAKEVVTGTTLLSLQPESPPFSPMMEPSQPAVAMEELCLGHSPVKRARSHQTGSFLLC
jgi:hypothetical protein